MARRVRVLYHHEPEGWWAESPDLPGWSAAGESYAEVQTLAHEGAEFCLEESVAVDGLFADAVTEQAACEELLGVQLPVTQVAPAPWVREASTTAAHGGAFVRAVTNLSFFGAQRSTAPRRDGVVIPA